VTITVATATAAATAAGATSNGVVWADAASDDTVVDVKINQFIPVASA
jgi:predicted RecA/RadA family phage recombinase